MTTIKYLLLAILVVLLAILFPVFTPFVPFIIGIIVILGIINAILNSAKSTAKWLTTKSDEGKTPVEEAKEVVTAEAGFFKDLFNSIRQANKSDKE